MRLGLPRLPQVRSSSATRARTITSPNRSRSIFEQAGIPAWLDATHLTPGADWAQSIEAALAGAGCVILVVSPDSVRSTQVRAEWQRARRHGQRIILALFRPAAIPDELSNAVVVDFRGRFKRGVNRLIDVVSNASRLSVPRTSASSSRCASNCRTRRADPGHPVGRLHGSRHRVRRSQRSQQLLVICTDLGCSRPGPLSRRSRILAQSA